MNNIKNIAMFIDDYQYSFIEDLLPGKKGDPGRSGVNNRLFIEAVLYIAKTGVGWRQLPEKYGNWQSAWKRFRRWSQNGIWQIIREKVANKIRKNKKIMILSMDSSCVKVHQDATRYIKKLQRRVPYRKDQGWK